MKRILVTLLALAFLAVGSLTAVAADQGAESYTFETKMGNVTFPHTTHQGIVADCTTCHHAGVDAGKCASCHGVDPKAPKSKDAFHALCKDCHKEKGGPTGCKDCHVK